MIEGDSNKSIARKIGIAEATVKVHVFSGWVTIASTIHGLERSSPRLLRMR